MNKLLVALLLTYSAVAARAAPDPKDAVAIAKIHDAIIKDGEATASDRFRMIELKREDVAESLVPKADPNLGCASKLQITPKSLAAFYIFSDVEAAANERHYSSQAISIRIGNAMANMKFGWTDLVEQRERQAGQVQALAKEWSLKKQALDQILLEKGLVDPTGEYLMPSQAGETLIVIVPVCTPASARG